MTTIVHDDDDDDDDDDEDDHDCPGSRRHKRGLQVHDRRTDEMSQKLQLLSLNLGFRPTTKNQQLAKVKKKKEGEG